ncbi:hypothetical protein [Polyangium sp. 6x1]|uniref:hypothetical protein n=1 Tax=Polyangium sp. 6x1 TaxID=3042689 RepID=UPI0024827820|nr:hypothetical protein [Polyangium sp. 6x1]MDI1449067.1 hypothetical protein [Polyangium sp. 6x1]
MRVFLHRLLVASQWGASLLLASGCGADVEGGPGAPGPAAPTQNLEPTPAPACYGPVHEPSPEIEIGYYGQCCDITLCTAPLNGVCPGTDEVVLTGRPPGSGECECEPLRGPYANENPAAPEACCYLVGSIGCTGRPLLVQGKPRLADVREGPSAWSSALDAPADRATALRNFNAALHELDTAALPAEVRALLARRWAEQGRNEHASVASFARFSMALMALGAPPALVEAAHHAALDEVRHARLAMSLASAYGGAPLGFGPLAVDGAFEDLGSLTAATLATVVEGCVGETLAAIEAAASAAEAGPRAVRLALLEIAEDEMRHAELGWAFVRWAIGTGGAALAAEVAATLEKALRMACADASVPGEEPPREHGFLPAEEVLSLRRQAAAQVLRPAGDALVEQGRAHGAARSHRHSTQPFVS